MRLLGVLLIFGGGGGMAALTLRQRQKELETVGELLYALHRMEREIRADGYGLQRIFTDLAEEMTGEARFFFLALMRVWGEMPEEQLSRHWENVCTELVLSKEGERIWRELGRRLAGDGESVKKGIALTTEELTVLQMQLKQAMPEQRRVVTALSLSGAAILSILLL